MVAVRPALGLRLGGFLLLALLLVCPAAGQNQGSDKVTVSLSSDTIALDQTATLTISIAGLADGLDIPAPETRDGGLQFSYSGRRITMNSINGTMSSSVEVDYTITPMRTGRHVIEPISGAVAGIPFTTESQRLEVTDVGTGTAPPPQAGRRNPWSAYPGGLNPMPTDPWGWPTRPEPEEDVLLEATLEPEVVYKHQPVYYNLRLLTTGRLLSDPRYNPIVPVGFLRVAFPQENSQEERHGSLYSVMSVKTAYFPLNEGEYTFDPSQVSVTSGFYNPRVLKTEAKKVKVLPLPGEGRPRSFTGAVGEQFEIRANLKNADISLGGNTELEVTVKGDGHLELVPYPFLPDWPGLEKKQLSSPSTTRVDNGKLVSQRTYNFRLKPSQVGSFSLSGIAFAYFNPSQERYEVIKAPDLTLRVEAGQSTATEGEPGADQEMADSDRPWDSPGADRGRLPELPLGALAGGVLLLLAGALAVLPGTRLAPPLRRPGSGRPIAARHKSLPDLSDALSRLAPGADSNSRRAYLEGQGWSASSIARLESLKRKAGRARFGTGASAGSDVLDGLNQELGELLREVKKR